MLHRFSLVAYFRKEVKISLKLLNGCIVTAAIIKIKARLNAIYMLCCKEFI
jgi:hypothetical protein